MEEDNIPKACQLFKEVKEAGGALVIMTGAGMSVSSGVPVFRHADGTMSPDFLRFLSQYNKACREHGLAEADDWFDFSVPEMFRLATEIEAWHYWRWRILRARVEPAEDYRMLQRLSQYFGSDKVFIVTSNCDELHVKAGADPSNIRELHGSLGSLQCSCPCSQSLHPVDEAFVARLANTKEPDWVPRCPECKCSCLRPNVMIFGDNALVPDKIDEQQTRFQSFLKECGDKFVVLEVGAGTVVASIRWEAERKGSQGKGLVRVNPSKEECAKCTVESSKYIPLVSKSQAALEGLCRGLDLLE